MAARASDRFRHADQALPELPPNSLPNPFQKVLFEIYWRNSSHPPGLVRHAFTGALSTKPMPFDQLDTSHVPCLYRNTFQ